MSLWFHVRPRVGCGAALVLALALGALRPHPCAAATPEQAQQTCRQQLKLLAEALGNYRQDHNGSFPDQLRQLLPRYVVDPTLLQCPAALEQGRAGPADPGLIEPGVRDPSVVGYTWEMSPEDPKDWVGRSLGMSFARFKQLQRRSLVGEYVPVIRCSHHGRDYCLNLTVDGTIYESGKYWECKFVDRIPVVRLDPRLVEQADKLMSELLRPRPAGATEAMVDLRRWCNARFEDPWVNCDPEMEKIQPNQLPGSEIITNRGIAFDAAGIIQVNGKLIQVNGNLNPGGDWKGFPELVYPKAVKSIAIKRAFRVMHVLGAVQFEDPQGTAVATVEIHRTGSTEKWTWRYGVDVLNYRFTPGKSESQLESSVVGWTGRFVHEAQGQRPRLFHLRFETAQPEVVANDLDFLAGEGVSSAFITAITLE